MIRASSGKTRRIGATMVFAASLLTCLPMGGPVAAQMPSQVFLDVSYLAAPTDWCPADEGVPMTVRMDGPDIIRGPGPAPKTVRERKGSTVRIIQTGENTASFNPVEDFTGPNGQAIGRFSAEFRACHSPWRVPRVTGMWKVAGPDGTDIGSGTFEDRERFILDPPFFSSVAGPSNAYFARFGDRIFYAADKPDITVTQMFLAKPPKE